MFDEEEMSQIKKVLEEKVQKDKQRSTKHTPKTRLTRRVPHVEQELPTIPKHLSSPPVFNGVHVTRSLVLCVCFVDRGLSQKAKKNKRKTQHNMCWTPIHTNKHKQRK
jgi:hypothetical protein